MASWPGESPQPRETQETQPLPVLAWTGEARIFLASASFTKIQMLRTLLGPRSSASCDTIAIVTPIPGAAF